MSYRNHQDSTKQFQFRIMAFYGSNYLFCGGVYKNASNYGVIAFRATLTPSLAATHTYNYKEGTAAL